MKRTAVFRLGTCDPNARLDFEDEAFQRLLDLFVKVDVVEEFSDLAGEDLGEFFFSPEGSLSDGVSEIALRHEGGPDAGGEKFSDGSHLR